MSHTARAGLSIAYDFAQFIEDAVLPGLDMEADAFWQGMSMILTRLAPRNRDLLAVRVSMQAQIDAWHADHRGQDFDAGAYSAFLREIGYLVEEPAPFAVDPTGIDAEVATMAGPQLVVPVLNARFLLNAANARWGSLYDALYGSDLFPDAPAGKGFDPVRGGQVIAWTKALLDDAVPMATGNWSDWMGGVPLLQDPTQLIAASPTGVLLRHNGLHIELVIDRTHSIGRDDPAGLADVILESALTTIVDLEDSVAAVDAQDKVAAYANWLGLMQGRLEAVFDKGGERVTRRLAADRHYPLGDGTTLTLAGRSLLFVRNVGHLMTTDMVRLPDGSDAPEGIIDAIVTSLIALYDLRGASPFVNSAAGSIYIVKPKMHGPQEAAFADMTFDAVEDMLGLARHTIKIGVMDEERRTSANLAACIYAVRHRIMFINTGFLDRTGDEIHTSMEAGPMVRKGEMKASAWIGAYEDRNVQIGLACGMAGRGQIGKGMWAAPDQMADMVAQKVAHPMVGASTAWVPSPTAATLHATHYHRVDVRTRQAARGAEPIVELDRLLTIPIAKGTPWSSEEIAMELNNNAQGILGYVVRWIDNGIGCSKVPDIHDISLMEDRATLRIASQHMANWLRHGVCSQADIDAALLRMAATVDRQNATDPAYEPMGDEGASLAFQTARALVMDGAASPNGYTEPLLHHFRSRKKAGEVSAVDLFV